ncbi:hypothetical protein BSL78_01926 [Apostichopus japonicus]|uniref:Uncharacterized protein n=1 Tax=Stichopus japonicus TaxID=307972 RepID=A0A2G8LLG8_STIJA|nr:hypothetical protein BSL78_01926 [Apostichopus japonicus]
MCYFQVEIRGGATLGLTGNATLRTKAVSGDHTGQLNILSGQQFDIISEHTLMPFSIFSRSDSSVTLPMSLDCKNVEMSLFGELNSLDHLKLSSHCIVGLQHSGDLAININHLDVKTFGSLLINDWVPGSTSLTGTTLNVRSGGMIRAGDLQLHYTNISLEPSSFLSVQYDPEAQLQVGSDVGYGVSSTSGSSGAGHGGNGGQGSSQNTVGTSYGYFAMPTDPGSSGGHAVFPHMGGEGAGKLFLETTDTLTIDGTLEAKGGDSRSPHSGGGSGGSIWIQTEIFDGDGTLNVGGGSGDDGGGGGAGGFAAIYYAYNHYSGDLITAGGESFYEPGGSGMVYLHHLQPINGTKLLDATSPEARIHHQSNVTSPLTNRTLYLNNLGRLPRVALRNMTTYYEAVRNIGAVTWLEPSEVAPIVRERNTPSHIYTKINIIIDELHVYGGAEIGFVRPSHRGMSSISD